MHTKEKEISGFSEQHFYFYLGGNKDYLLPKISSTRQSAYPRAVGCTKKTIIRSPRYLSIQLYFIADLQVSDQKMRGRNPTMGSLRSTQLELQLSTHSRVKFSSPNGISQNKSRANHKSFIVVLKCW